MKVLMIATAMLLVGFTSGFAQCDELKDSKGKAASPTLREASAPDIEAVREALKAEKEFKATGPKLFSMDDALIASKKTGKPVVCWMGPHIFANAKARQVSEELGDTTIQAVMDTDGETKDSSGNPLPLHRVKFSNGSYGKDDKVAFIPVAKLTDDSGRKILSFTRGGTGR